MLELPFTAPLSLNDRSPWPVKARQTKKWREAAHWLARAQRIPRLGGVSIRLFYVPAQNRRRDALNLVASLKAVEDGIVDAGVIADDSGQYHRSEMPVVTEPGPPRLAGNRLWVELRRRPR